jgi:hypothetical protein
VSFSVVKAKAGKSGNTKTSLPVILSTNKGIKALADFLQKSGAFSRTGTLLAAPQAPSFKFENEPIPDSNQEINPIMIDDDGG